MREFFKRKSICAMLTAVSIASSNLISPSPLIADDFYDENGNCCDNSCGLGLSTCDYLLIGGGIAAGAAVGAIVGSSERGDHGKRGDRGPIGLMGLTGPRGPTGATGGTGATGATGPDGGFGPHGPTGAAGGPGTFPTPFIGPDMFSFRFESFTLAPGNIATGFNPFLVGFVVQPDQTVATTSNLYLNHQAETLTYGGFFVPNDQEAYIGVYDLGFAVSDALVAPQEIGAIEVNFFKFDPFTGTFAPTADNDVYTTPSKTWQANEQFYVQFVYSPDTTQIVPVGP